jgi:hypothetical protein
MNTKLISSLDLHRLFSFSALITAGRRHKASAKMAGIILLAILVVTPAAWPVDLTEFSGAAHGFPALRDLAGKKIAEAEFMQWVQDDRLHVRLIYRFKDGRRIEEKAVLRQQPELTQDEWSWRESKGGEVFRECVVKFASGTATAQKREKNEFKHWEEKMEVEPGKTFAGFGFTIAIQNLRKRLLAGERIELKAIGFTPKPQMVGVQISHAGVERMEMSGRRLKGDHFVIHPDIPAIAKIFVHAPDTQVWLTNPAPPGFLRWEGPLGEPGDPVVRVDLLPGEGSASAQPVKSSGSE